MTSLKTQWWMQPRGAQQLDERTFIKFVKHHQQAKQPSPKRSKPSTTGTARPQPPTHPGWRDVKPAFGCEWLVIRRPEGYGKSSLVKQLIDKGRRIVFCTKSNLQLREQEKSFRDRWPELKIVRYLSKAQNLSESVQAITGEPFNVSNYQGTSPYSPPTIDAAATIRRLAELVGEAEAERLFQNQYEGYKSPEINGAAHDLVLITIAAFQALCTSFKQTWWERLGFKEKYLGPQYDDNPKAKPKEWVCLPKVIVCFDDPDRTDFDWLRPVIDEDVDTLAAKVRYTRTRTIKYKVRNADGSARDHAFLPESRAISLHPLVKRRGVTFERRQERATLGFGLWRKAGRARPMAIILTTELVTAALAKQTFGNLIQAKEARRLRSPLKDMQDVDGPFIEDLSLIEKQKRFAVSDWNPPTDQSHVTLIYTPLVRKRNHAMLIPIVQELRERFPGEDLTFIANGLDCEWNLSNTRGINTLTDKATLIKLSHLHPLQSLALLSHFKDDFPPMEAVMSMLADQANQALGRNQGYRFKGKPAIILCEPRYMGMERLLRYQTTPWSTKPHGLGSPMQYHGDKPTELEEWLKYRLHTASWFAASQLGQHYASMASPGQQNIFAKWLKAR